ncbi:putative nuclear membrane fusion protein Kar5 [Aspergillus foveolatus]|uniref:putative nuclear membrane fusion protein Kar5 n=1 Tax=Aspergillus foveolatus TaxID=210207 RepID=UPI003CCD5DB1
MEAHLVSLLRLSPYIFFLYTLLFPVISRADVALGALQLLETLNSSSSCNKLAATKLVSSCKSIGRNAESTGGSDTYLTLESVRSLYAARLAICELREAGIPTPSACRLVDHFQPPRRGLWGRNPKSSFVTDFDNMPKSDFEPCIRVLESRPQWWTSYSNSKQNAVIICQASRIEIDKEDILETYNSILHSSAKLSDGLHEALRTAAEESTKSRAFVQSTELLRKEMLREMQESTSTLLERMFHNLETRLGLLTEALSSTLQRFRLGLSSLEGVSQSLSIPRQHNAEKHNELALSLQSKLKSITKDDITELRQGVENIDSSLEWLYARIVRIYEQEASVSERLRGIGSSLAEFQQRADNLDKVQQRQYEIAVAQAQAQQVLEENMRISKGILDQIMSTAANLQTMIGETADTAEAIRHYIPSLLSPLWTSLPPIKCTDLIYCAFEFLKFQSSCQWLALSGAARPRCQSFDGTENRQRKPGLGTVICRPLTGFVTIRARQLQGQAYSLSNLAFPHASSMYRTIACAMRSTAVRYIFG